MSIRILPLLAFSVWCFFCRNWYVCHIKQRCGESIQMSKIGEPPVVSNEPDSETPPISQSAPKAVAPIQPEKTVAEKNVVEKPVEAAQSSNAMVEKAEDRIIIHYDYNKLDKEANAEVDAYLEQLADNIKSSGQKVTLIGHTDGVGDGSTNLKVSERRAKNVRDILRLKGVPVAQIITKGKGESQPIGSNDNPTGRRQNRRVEVFLSN